MSRHCVECDRPLHPTEQGALCSGCYFEIICDPGLADPGPSAEDERRWVSAAAAPPPR